MQQDPWSLNALTKKPQQQESTPAAGDDDINALIQQYGGDDDSDYYNEEETPTLELTDDQLMNPAATAIRDTLTPLSAYKEQPVAPEQWTPEAENEYGTYRSKLDAISEYEAETNRIRQFNRKEPNVKDIVAERERNKPALSYAEQERYAQLSRVRDAHYGAMMDEWIPKLQERSDELTQEIRQAEEAARQEQKLLNANNNFGGTGLGTFGAASAARREVVAPEVVEKQEQQLAVRTAIDYAKKMRDLSQVSSTDYLQAAGKAFANHDYVNMATFGMKQLATDFDIVGIKKRKAEGKELTPDEQAALEMSYMFEQYSSEKEVPLTYDAVGSFLESIPYMVEIAVSGSATAGVRSFVKKNATRLLGKSKAASAAGDVLGFIAQTAVRPLAVPSMPAREAMAAYDNKFITFEGMDGELHVRDAAPEETFVTSAMKGYGKAMISILAEQSGDAMTAGYKAIGKSIGRKYRDKQFVNALSKYSQTFKKASSINDLGTEMIEEYVEKFANTLIYDPVGAEKENLEHQGLGKWDEFFTWREGLTIFGSTLMTQAAFKLLRIPGDFTVRKQRSRVIDASKRLPEGIKEPLMLAMENDDPQERTDALMRIGLEKVTGVEERGAIMDYIKEKTHYDFIKGVELGQSEYQDVENAARTYEGMQFKNTNRVLFATTVEGRPVTIIDGKYNLDTDEKIVPVGIQVVRDIETGETKQFGAEMLDNVEEQELADLQREAIAEALNISEQREQAMEAEELLETGAVQEPQVGEVIDLGGQPAKVAAYENGKVVVEVGDMEGNPIATQELSLQEWISLKGEMPSEQKMVEAELQQEAAEQQLQQEQQTSGAEETAQGAEPIANEQEELAPDLAPDEPIQEEQAEEPAPNIQTLSSADGKITMDVTLNEYNVGRSNNVYGTKQEADKAIKAIAARYSRLDVKAINTADPNDPFAPDEWRIVVKPKVPTAPAKPKEETPQKAYSDMTVEEKLADIEKNKRSLRPEYYHAEKTKLEALLRGEEPVEFKKEEQPVDEEELSSLSPELSTQAEEPSSLEPTDSRDNVQMVLDDPEATPDQMFAAFQEELRNAPYNALEPWQQAALTYKVRPQDFADFNDGNNIGLRLAKKFFDSDALALDEIAMELSEMAGKEIEPGEVAQFLHDVANGLISTRKTTDRMNALRSKYRQQTGESIDRYDSSNYGTAEEIDELLEKNGLTATWFTPKSLLATIETNKSFINPHDYERLIELSELYRAESQAEGELYAQLLGAEDEGGGSEDANLRANEGGAADEGGSDTGIREPEATSAGAATTDIIDPLAEAGRRIEAKKVSEEIATEEAKVDTNPTEAQKEAGNYKKGHVKVRGFDITIENPKGSTRSGTDENGNKWESTMNNTYGYFKRTEGKDGDQIDVFFSDNPTLGKVFVVDQVNPETGQFDEHKVMMGFETEEQAKEAYLSNYSEGWKGMGAITEVNDEQFKEWVGDGKRKLKPVSDKVQMAIGEAFEQPEQEKTKVVVIPNGITPFDKQAQSFIKAFLSKVTTKQKLKFSEGKNEYDMLAVMDKNGEIVMLVKTPEDAYKAALNSDNEEFHIVRERKEGKTITYDYYTDSLFGDHDTNDLYDERGYLKDSVKQSGIDAIKKWINPTPDLTESVKTESVQKAQFAGELFGEQEQKGEEKPKQPQPQQKIDDFGEKLEGARKDMVVSMNDQIKATKQDFESQPLSKVLPKLDYVKMVESGVATQEEVALLHWFRSNIPAKPRKSYRMGKWHEAIKAYQNILEYIVNKEDFIKVHGKDFMSAMDVGLKVSSLERVRNDIKILVDLGFPTNNVDLKDFTIHESDGSWKRFRNGEEIPIEGYILTRGYSIVADFKTWEEAIERLKTLLDVAKENKRKVKFDVWSQRGKEGYIVGKKVAAGKYIALAEGFEKSKDAFAYIRENQEQLEQTLEQKKSIPPERTASDKERTGYDFRQGKDVTPEMFTEAFGFRGVQFGNYVEQSKRQQDLNEAYDALMDLAFVMDVPPKALSLAGSLGLAFGARGKGGKDAPMAHYESGTVVINLTKNRGAGTLAHEWFHAMDNYFERMRGRNGKFLTESPRQRVNNDGTKDERVRVEVLDAFKGVMEAINNSGLPKRSRELDGRKTKDYWSTELEMAARAFEVYAKEKMEKKGYNNDYLVSMNDIVEWVLAGGEDNSYPFPTDKEMETIGKAFDKLVETLQTKEENGKTVLFSRKDNGDGGVLKPMLTPDRDYLFNVLPDPDKITTKEEIAEYNAKAEILDRLYKAGFLGEDFTNDIEEDWVLEKIGEKRYYSEILEEKMEELESLEQSALDNGEEKAEDYLQGTSIPANLSVEELAIQSKGLTDYLQEAGYILQDGRLLDFSGKRNGGDSGVRYEDHRQLAIPVKEELDPTDQMNAFMKTTGAIRIDYNGGAIDIETKPTPSQLRLITRVLRDNKDTWTIDLQDGNRKLSLQGGAIQNAINNIGRFYKDKTLGTGANDAILFSMKSPTGEPAVDTDLSEFADEILDAAKQQYGTTNDVREAGYLLPDGSMLDFSDGKQGQRSIDHNDVTAVGITKDMFLDFGGIRINSAVNGIELNKKPTLEQFTQLRDYFNKAQGTFTVDINTPDGNVLSSTYTTDTPFARIKNDVSNYFTTGIKPRGVLFSLVGEQGAANIDQAEEAAVRLNNLDVAREMEESGKTPKDIRLATGWERGADRKWRYEADDLKVKGKFSDIPQDKEMKLSDIVKDGELLKAYPQLKETKIILHGKSTNVQESSTGLQGTAIGISALQLELLQRQHGRGKGVAKQSPLSSEAALESVLSHEVQHLIQRIEGFEQGTTREQVWAHLVENERKRIDEEGQHQDLDEGTKNAVADSRAGEANGSPFQAYRSAAGEVEARNVQRRAALTPEERRRILLSETEDVARKDQLFLENAFGVSEFALANKPLYANTERAIEQVEFDKGTTDQWKAALLKHGAKEAELKWMGWYTDFVSDNPSDKPLVLTREEVQSWIDSNKVQLEEVVKGDASWYGNELINNGETVANLIHNEDGTWSYQSNFSEGSEKYDTREDAMRDAEEATVGDIYSEIAPKFHGYATPGGTNYKEVLLTLPFGKDGWEQYKNNSAGKTFKSSHWNEPNVVVHTRFSEFTDKDGKRVLHIDEIQSDWQQEGRKKGFKKDDKDVEQEKPITKDEIEITETEHQYAAEIRGTFRYVGKGTVKDAEAAKEYFVNWLNKDIVARNEHLKTENRYAIPQMPFQQTDQIVGLAMKRILHYAAENGFDRVSWTMGEQQADRYDLSKQVDEVETIKSGDVYSVFISKDQRKSGLGEYTANKLPDVVGKELAQKIIDSYPEGVGGRSNFKGLDLKVGGEGMKAFYDSIIPSWVNKFGKKFGAKVSSTQIDTKPHIVEDGSIDLSTGEVGEIAKDKWLPVHSVDITNAMAAAALEGLPMFSQGLATKRKAQGITQALNDLNQHVEGKYQAIVVASEAELEQAMNENGAPRYIKENVLNAIQGTPGTVQGFLDPNTNKVYIVASNHENVDEARKTWIHEVAGHAGLEALIPNKKERDMVLQAVFNSVGREKILEALKEAGKDVSYYETISETELASEYLAVLAEKLVSARSMTVQERSIWNDFVAWVNRIIRKVYKTPNVVLSNYEIGTIVLAAAEAVKRKGIPDTVTVDGKQRPTTNSNGKPIADTVEKIENFWKWFGDSKVVDEEGKPMVVYHGTPNGNFDIFHEGSHFTKNRIYADRYQNQGASSISYKKEAVKPLTYDTYLTIKKPFDTRDNEARELFYGNYQAMYSPDVSERGLVDWLEATDLMEWIKENHPEYDGILVDEGSEPKAPVEELNKQYEEVGENLGWRGITYIPFDPTQIKSATGNKGTFDPTNKSILLSQRYMPEVPEPNEKPKFSIAGEMFTGEKKQKHDFGKIVAELKDRIATIEMMGKPAEKAAQAIRRVVIEQFIRENREALTRIRPKTIPAILNRINNAARTDHSLETALSALQRAVETGEMTEARRKARAFVSGLKRMKTTFKSGGVVKAKVFLQEGKDARDAIIYIASMEPEEVDHTRDLLEKFIEGETEAAEELGNVSSAFRNIDDAEFMLSLLDTYGNLEDKSLDDVNEAIERWKGDLEAYRKEYKEFREKERERTHRLQSEIRDDVGGSKELVREVLLNDTTPQEDRVKGDPFMKKYQALMGTISSLSHAIWRGFKVGKDHKEFYQSKLYQMYKAVDNGGSRKAQMQYDMKKRIQKWIKEMFGSERAFAKEMKGEMEITLDMQTGYNKETGEPTYSPRRVKISTDTALHLWLSYQSESNRRYMNNIDYGKEKHRATQLTFEEIDAALSQRAKDFANVLATDFFGAAEYYHAVNDVYQRKTGRKLPQLPGYVPVAANTWRNSIPYDVNNLGIYKSFTNERRGGAYDLDRNSIYGAALKYADGVSSFAHLAEPISDFAYTLNSRVVSSALKAMGTYGKAQRIIDLLNKGYNEQRVDGQEMFQTLLRRFVSTKILTNYNLLPKQLTSLVTAFDSDFGNPLVTLKEMMLYVAKMGQGEQQKVVRDIVHNHPDLKFRNMTDIESLTKMGKAKIHVHMFGDSRKDVALGMLATALWNPTAVGDRIAIGMGGIPLAIGVYKQELNRAKKEGLADDAAKARAAEAAANVISEFINTTQQSAKITHKGAIQYGGWRTMTAFMNSLMGYARKVSRHARDIHRDYQASYLRYIKKGDSFAEARLKAVADIPFVKFADLFLYTSVLPVLFTTVGTLGGNFARLWDDDDDERRKARWQMLFDATLGWTKGLFGIGFLLEYGVNEAMGVSFGKRDDNILPALDDVLELTDAVLAAGRLAMKYNDETIKNRSEYERKLYKNLARVGITGTGLATGAPTTFMHRIFDVSTGKEYDEGLEMAARIYGVPKQEIRRLFDQTKMLNENVEQLWDKSPKEYLDEVKKIREENNSYFSPSKELRVFQNYKMHGIEDRQTMADMEALMGTGNNDKKVAYTMRRFEQDYDQDIDRFHVEFMRKYTKSPRTVFYKGSPLQASPVITDGLKDRIWLELAQREFDGDEMDSRKVEAIRDIKRRAGEMNPRAYRKIRAMMNELK